MRKNIIKNVVMLYGLSIAKIIFPLLTLPYLTRVLSVDCYGQVAYVKTLMQYIQIFVDFGFILSGTKEIAENREDRTKLACSMGDILIAKIALGVLGLLVTIVLILSMPLLRSFPVYTLLSYLPVFLSIFLFEHYFRGIERMEFVTTRYVVATGLSTALTFVLVHGDSDILWIPALNTISSLLAIILVVIELKKDDVKLRMSSVASVVGKITSSSVYFISNMATTAFGALNTVIIGACMSASDVAYWSVCMQIIGGIQTFYNPITNGIYPDMVRTKDAGLIKRVFRLVMPVVALGSVFTYCVAPHALRIVFGAQYRDAYPVLRVLISVLVFSFPGMLFGWPTLGAIGKSKEVTFTTVCTAFFQVIGLLLLFVFRSFSLFSVAVLRGMTEMVLMATRLGFCIKYRGEFK